MSSLDRGVPLTHKGDHVTPQLNNLHGSLLTQSKIQSVDNGLQGPDDLPSRLLSPVSLLLLPASHAPRHSIPPLSFDPLASLPAFQAPRELVLTVSSVWNTSAQSPWLHPLLWSLGSNVFLLHLNYPPSVFPQEPVPCSPLAPPSPVLQCSSLCLWSFITFLHPVLFILQKACCLLCLLPAPLEYKYTVLRIFLWSCQSLASRT